MSSRDKLKKLLEVYLERINDYDICWHRTGIYTIKKNNEYLNPTTELSALRIFVDGLIDTIKQSIYQNVPKYLQKDMIYDIFEDRTYNIPYSYYYDTILLDVKTYLKG